MKKFLRCIFLLPVIILLGAGVARADMFASPTGPSEYYFPNGVAGSLFSPNQDIVLTHLGIWDYQSNGLSGSHEVGIYSLSGVLLAENTIGPGATGLLVGESRFVAQATTLALYAGTEYVIAAEYNGAGIGDYLTTQASVSPVISLIGDRFEFDWDMQGLFFPTSSFLDPGVGIFGPNFLFEIPTSSVPEPATMFLLGLGFGLVGAVKVWKRRFPA